MKEEKILVNGLEVNYKIAGLGPAILVLHGWGGASDSWLKVQEILAKQGYQVVCPDFPGFGKTPPPPEPWGLSEFASIILTFAEKVDLDSFFLLGHSFGGRISIKIASQHPEKVKKLILCASAGIKPKPGFKTRMIYIVARIGNAVFSPRHLARFKDAARNFLYIFIRNRDYVKAEGVMKETIKRIFIEDSLNEMAQIQAKTLLVWGEMDKLIPLKYASVFQEKIENSELKTFPKIGHSPHLEVPKKLAEVILEFLKR